MPNKWYIILNPEAGTGSPLKVKKQLFHAFKACDISFVFVQTDKPRHAEVLAKEAVLAGYRCLLAVGGDGTLNEVVNGIFQQKEVATSKLTVSVFPSGTGNDWVRTHCLPKNPQQFAQLLKQGRSVLHNIGICIARKDNHTIKHHFINMSGIGFSAAVVQHLENFGKWFLPLGVFGYVMALLISLLGFKASEVSLKLDGKIIRKPLFNLAVGICSYAGGGMQLLPQTQFDNEYLDFSFVENVSVGKVLKNVVRIFNGTYIHLKEVSVGQSKIVEIQSPVALACEVDGESLGAFKQLEINILPKSIKVLVV